MAVGELINTSREVLATEIPAGVRTTIPAGASLRIIQTLGGNFTVMTDRGELLRIANADADAIGETPMAPPAAQPGVTGADPNAPFSEQAVWEQLKTVYDPEIPVDIVELGLIYECKHEPTPQGGERVGIKMSLTAPGCGMSEVLKRDVEQKVANLPGVREVQVEVVFDPPWTPERMSDAAKLKLGLL